MVGRRNEVCRDEEYNTFGKFAEVCIKFLRGVLPLSRRDPSVIAQFDATKYVPSRACNERNFEAQYGKQERGTFI